MIKVLKKRWKNGTSKQRRIQNVPELASSIPSLLTMNEKWIAMGCSSGEILVFDRKTLAQLNQVSNYFQCMKKFTLYNCI